MIGRVVRLIVSGLIAFLLTSIAVAEEKTPRRLVVPSDEALAIMIKTVLIAYNDANLFEVVSDLITDTLDFQDDTLGAKLGAKVGKEEAPSSDAPRNKLSQILSFF